MTKQRDMTCTCDFDEYNQASKTAGCPIHDRSLTVSERLYTLAGQFARLLGRG